MAMAEDTPGREKAQGPWLERLEVKEGEQSGTPRFLPGCPVFSSTWTELGIWGTERSGGRW